MRRAIVLLLMQFCWLAAPAEAAQLDETPRIAVMSAFAPELAALAAATEDKKTYDSGPAVFITGTLEGKPVVLFLSGMSMVNAALTTQAALDRFNIERIVFSGIAGGVDPSLDVGDVVVAERWSQYLESIFARETAPGAFAPPPTETPPQVPNYGMIYPRGVLLEPRPGQSERKLWFDADPAMVEVARKVAGSVTLKRCIAELCLTKSPRVVVGGEGVSGPVFMDNAAFRQYAHATFGAEVLDMESAAVAHVAYLNHKPFIAFRSLSDLAGGDPGDNQARTFFQIASDNSAAVVQAFIKALP
jgi:adenosylhomocysteine nucleosidase